MLSDTSLRIISKGSGQYGGSVWAMVHEVPRINLALNRVLLHIFRVISNEIDYHFGLLGETLWIQRAEGVEEEAAHCTKIRNFETSCNDL